MDSLLCKNNKLTKDNYQRVDRVGGFWKGVKTLRKRLAWRKLCFGDLALKDKLQ